MNFDFPFPDVGEGIAEGRLVEWLVKENDMVVEDQPLARVETDKAVVDLPSPKTGKIATCHIRPGDLITVGQVMVTLTTTDEVSPPDRAPTPPAPGKISSTDTAPLAQQPQRPLATPHTRALARRLGVSLGDICGTGRGGRITDTDVEQAAAPMPKGHHADAHLTQLPQTAPSPANPRGDKTPERPPAGPTLAAGQTIELPHLRRVIAQAMDDSVRTAAHVTHVDEVDLTDLIELKSRVADRLALRTGKRPTLLPYFIRALIAQLKTHPKFNATYDAKRQTLTLHRRYDIGIAVDTPDGLIVPVIKNADTKSIEHLALEIDDLASRAKQRALTLSEITGGTCTVTNIGPLGGLLSTPIIHQPEMAIVAFQAIKKRPIHHDGGIALRSMMYLCISFDHRIIDGGEAARFTNDLVETLADPDLLMARI